jgi:hypothetical protein
MEKKTDLQKFIELLESWGVRYELHTWGPPLVHEVSFDPDSEDPKVIGNEYASCEFTFGEDEKFVNIEICGD